MKMQWAAAAVAIVSAGLSFSQPGARQVLPGSPLPGITPSEHELFRLGLEDFTEVETAEDGLGPAFNGNSCAVCHSVPAIGGVSAMTEVRAGYRDENGKFTALYGGTLYHLFSTPPHRCQVQIPPEANVIARRAPIPLFGAGLVEAIADETIIALEDPDDRDGDGIRGRAARIIDVVTRRERIGRFGWKAQHAALLGFAGDAYRNEMGITNDLFPDEAALGVDPERLRLCSPKRGIEDVRDRSTGLRGIDNFESFMKFLAPIERGPIDDSVRAGEAVFRTIGCASCHVPVLTTGSNANPLFDRKPVALFSNLLLHDIGTGDGIEQSAAGAGEIRTPALWGLRFRRPLLHDGSAATPEDAIIRHGKEASGVLERYRTLPPSVQRQLLAFLKSL
jgi:CxxC motif-containing protein (DUF1111 family)